MTEPEGKDTTIMIYGQTPWRYTFSTVCISSKLLLTLLNSSRNWSLCCLAEFKCTSISWAPSCALSSFSCNSLFSRWHKVQEFEPLDFWYDSWWDSWWNFWWDFVWTFPAATCPAIDPLNESLVNETFVDENGTLLALNKGGTSGCVHCECDWPDTVSLVFLVLRGTSWQDEVDRWFFKCQRYLISLFSKHVNQRKEGGQKRAKNGQRSFWMPPKSAARLIIILGF